MGIAVEEIEIHSLYTPKVGEYGPKGIPPENEGDEPEVIPPENEEDEPKVIPPENEEDEKVINDWEVDIRAELPKQTLVENEPEMKIPRVPERLRSDKDAPYDPRIISIGPYHQGQNNLKPMEKHKWQYLQAILLRNPKNSLKKYISGVKALEGRARNYYSGEFKLESKMFVTTMLLDGCFIVEYLLRKSAYKCTDLGGMIWMDALLLRDLLLLENQLPFCILKKIYDLATKTAENGKAIPSSLEQVVMDFFSKMFSSKKTGVPSEPIFHHLLHIYYCFLLMPIHGKPEEDSPEAGTIISMIPNATALQKAGIKFKKRKLEVEGRDILDVKFNRGVLEIPPLHINASTKTQFRNLIAFEEFHPRTKAKFTAYIIFLDNIVNTAEDVALLHRNGIIEHMLGSDKEVADLFNELINGTFTRSKNYLSELYKNVDTHYRAKKHRWWAYFVHTYLNSPWKILSLWAGIMLLVLTFLQTFFSVFSYFRPPSF